MLKKRNTNTDEYRQLTHTKHKHRTALVIELRVRHCTASRVFLLLDFVISVHSKRRACKTKNKVRMSYQWTLPCLRYVFSWIVIFTVSNVISSFTVVLQDRRERVSLESRKVLSWFCITSIHAWLKKLEPK